MGFGVIAERKNSFLRLALEGLSGTGKTYSALVMMEALGCRKIGLLDSEHRSALKHAGAKGIPRFLHEPLEEHTIQAYLQKMEEAAADNVDGLIIDSWSHSWIAALAAVDAMGGNKYTNGWKAISPLVKQLNDSMLRYPGHEIATLRLEDEYAVEKDEKTGKAVPRKIGLKPVARKGTDYEFDFVLTLGGDGNVTVSKTRWGDRLPLGSVFPRSDLGKVAHDLRAWLSEGVPQTPLERLADGLRFAANEAALMKAATEIKPLVDSGAITSAQRDDLFARYTARKAELQGVAL